MPAPTVETTRAPVRRWEHLTGADFASMDRARAVVVVPSSPLEVHGPHLPVVTDIQEATGLALRVMEEVTARAPGREFLLMPPIFVASDVVPHPGSVMFRPETVRAVCEDLGRSLCAQGFRDIWLVSFHGGPRHFLTMEVAAEAINRRYGARMVSVLSMMMGELGNRGSELGQTLAGVPGFTREVLDGDDHGGALETSLMLYLLGEHVSPSYKELPKVTLGTERARRGLGPLKVGKRPGPLESARLFRALLKYYEGQTWSGSPAAASAEAGAQILEILAQHTARHLLDVLEGRRDPRDCHSPLWPLRRLLLQGRLVSLFERAIQYKTQVF
jgi:creatinine amidohydrolase